MTTSTNNNTNFYIFKLTTFMKDLYSSLLKDITCLKEKTPNKFNKRYKRLKFVENLLKHININIDLPEEDRIEIEKWSTTEAEASAEINPINKLREIGETVKARQSKSNENKMYLDKDFKSNEAYGFKKKVNDQLTNYVNKGNPYYFQTSKLMDIIIQEIRNRSSLIDKYFRNGTAILLLKGSTAYNLLLKELIIENKRSLSQEHIDYYNLRIDQLFTDGDNDTEIKIVKPISKDAYDVFYKKITKYLNQVMNDTKLSNELKKNCNIAENLILIYGDNLYNFTSMDSKNYKVDDHKSQEDTMVLRYLNEDADTSVYYSSIDVSINENVRFRLMRYKNAFKCKELPNVKFSSELLDVVVKHPSVYSRNTDENIDNYKSCKLNNIYTHFTP